MIPSDKERKAMCNLAERRLYSVKEAGHLMGRSKLWVTQQVQAGELLGVRMPRLMINGPSINRFIEQRWV